MAKIWLTLTSVLAGFSAPEARSQGVFPSLDSFQTLCYDTQAVGQIMLLYQSVIAGPAVVNPVGAAAPATGLQFAASYMANTIPRICSLVVAVASAKDTEGVLRAARVANNVLDLQLDTALSIYDDTTSIYSFLARLAPATENSKEKLLNVNNHRRMLNFASRQVFPMVKKWSGSELSQQKVVRDINQARARAAQANTLRQQLAGCREPLKSSQPKAGRIEINGREYSFAKFNNLSSAQGKQAEKERLATAKARKFRSSILRMLEKVVRHPYEFVSAQTVLDRLFRSGYWVSVEYRRANSTELTPPIIDTRGGVGNEIEIVEDRSKQEYVTQQGFSGAACSNEEGTRWQAWIMSNSNIINDKFIDPSFIADSVAVCPQAFDLNNLELESIVSVTDDKWLATKAAEASQAQEKKCKFNTAAGVLGSLNNLRSLGGARGGLGADRRGLIDPGPLCPPSKPSSIPPEGYVQDYRDLRTVADFIDYYNRAFALYIEAKTGVSVKENAVSRGGRSLARGINSLFGKERSTDGGRFSSEQLGIISRWRSVTRCDNYKTLEDRYGKTFTDIYSNESTATQSDTARGFALAELIDRCRREESRPENNGVIFRDMFNGMFTELKTAAEAEREIVKFELEFGSYKNTTFSDKGCSEPLKPMDLSRIGVGLQALKLEQGESLIESRNFEEQKRIAEQVALQEHVDSVELKRTLQMQRLIKNGIVKTGGGSLETGIETEKAKQSIMPEHVTKGQRDREMGDGF